MAFTKRSEHRMIRPATSADAFDLADIRNASYAEDAARTGAQTPMREELDFLDRLSLPHGDDYFCIVAEEQGRVLGYLIGGGSRDLDRKAHGEIYEIAVLPSARRRGLGRALLNDALGRFDDAAFAGTLLNAPAGDHAVAGLAIGLGMIQERLRGENGEFVRYERPLRRPPDRTSEQERA